MDETGKTAKFNKVTVDASEEKILEAVRDKSRKSFQNGARLLAENLIRVLRSPAYSSGVSKIGIIGQIHHELKMLGIVLEEEPK